MLPYTEHMARFAFCGILWALKKRRNSNFFFTTFSKFSGTCPVFCIFSPPDECCLVDGDPIEPVHSINGRRAFFLRLATKGLSCSALLTWIPPRRKRRSKTSSRAAQKKLFFAVHTRTPSVITCTSRGVFSFGLQNTELPCPMNHISWQNWNVYAWTKFRAWTYHHSFALCAP